MFRKIVRIERLPVRAAILVSYVPRGRWIWNSTKMAARNAKSSILEILQKIIGDYKQSWANVSTGITKRNNYLRLKFPANLLLKITWEYYLE